jgi:hypothetical protein
MALAALLAAGQIGLSIAGLWNYYFVPAYAKAPTWRDLAAVLNSEVDPAHDVIIRNYPDPTFFYYYQGDAEVVLLPEAPGLDPAPGLEALAQEYAYLWFMPQPDPNWSPDAAVEQWLGQNILLVSDQMAGAMRVQQYAKYSASAGEIGQPVGARYGDFVTLAGYNITPRSQAEIGPGSMLWVELFWLPTGQTDLDLTVFVHLLGPPKADGSIYWAGHDHPPQGGRTGTSSWQDGMLLRDVYQIAIPPDAPPGTYTVAAGYYNPADNTRVLEVEASNGLAAPGAARLFDLAIGAEQ